MQRKINFLSNHFSIDQWLINKRFSKLLQLLIWGCFFISINAVQAQSQDFTSTWQLSFDESYTYFSSNLKNHYEKLDASGKTAFKSRMESNQLILKNDNTAKIGTPGKQLIGTWQVSANQLTLNFGVQGSLSYTIVSHQNNRLILHANNVQGNSQVVYLKNE